MGEAEIKALEDFQKRYDELIDMIEFIEGCADPDAMCANMRDECALSTYDLQRILGMRRRWPHWVEERSIPYFLVTKCMSLEGYFGPEKKAFVHAHDWSRNGPLSDDLKAEALACFARGEMVYFAADANQ